MSVSHLRPRVSTECHPHRSTRTTEPSTGVTLLGARSFIITGESTFSQMCTRRSLVLVLNLFSSFFFLKRHKITVSIYNFGRLFIPVDFLKTSIDCTKTALDEQKLSFIHSAETSACLIILP